MSRLDLESSAINTDDFNNVEESGTGILSSHFYEKIKTLEINKNGAGSMSIGRNSKRK